jgi:hypothetical protein
MQTLSWYTRRLRHMSPGELAWRARTFVRDLVDRPRVHFQMLPAAVDDRGAAKVWATSLRLSQHTPGCWRDSPDPIVSVWLRRLVGRAEALLDHRFTFFGLKDRHLGNPIDWNRDHEAGTPTPLEFASRIDYRDARVTGDAKVVWEPGRHHQLVVLGRAYRATGDRRYAAEVIAQIDSWIEQCPFGRGMHWRSPLELAIRAINWVWAIDLIRPSGVLTEEAGARVLNALYLHVWEVARKYSHGSSANNHRIGEAAGVFVVTTCLPGLKNASRWRTESRRILEEEILAQTYPDGGSREQAFGYHMFVLQFLLLSAFVARQAGDELSSAYLARLERMLEFAAAMVEGGPPPAFGDSDDAYVIDLGNAGDALEWIGAGAALLARSDLSNGFAQSDETVNWLLGSPARPIGSAPVERRSRTLASRAFPDSGYYILQCGSVREGDAISVVFDCGELGFGPLAAHGHADALAFTLRAFGEDILVDPGTYDYFRFPPWRAYFRGTRAHNTIGVDDLDQSTMLGGFMWGQRASARAVEWQLRPGGGAVAGSHDGYRRLRDPVEHVRRLELDGEAGTLTLTDRLAMKSAHSIRASLHFAEHCALSSVGSRIDVKTSRGSVRFDPDPRLTASLHRGEVGPIAGWVSRRYHCKTATTTIVLSGTFDRDVSLVTKIFISPSTVPSDSAK